MTIHYSSVFWAFVHVLGEVVFFGGYLNAELHGHFLPELMDFSVTGVTEPGPVHFIDQS